MDAMAQDAIVLFIGMTPVLRFERCEFQGKIRWSYLHIIQRMDKVKKIPLAPFKAWRSEAYLCTSGKLPFEFH